MSKHNLPEWIKRLMVADWLYRAYYSCGSDIFAPTIYSKDYDYRLDLSDRHYLLCDQRRLDDPHITGSKSGHRTKKSGYDPVEKIGDLEEYKTIDYLIDKRNFSSADMFIGLYDRIFPGIYEDKRRFTLIMQQMDEYMEDFLLEE